MSWLQDNLVNYETSDDDTLKIRLVQAAPEELESFEAYVFG